MFYKVAKLREFPDEFGNGQKYFSFSLMTYKSENSKPTRSLHFIVFDIDNNIVENDSDLSSNKYERGLIEALANLILSYQIWSDEYISYGLTLDDDAIDAYLFNQVIEKSDLKLKEIDQKVDFFFGWNVEKCKALFATNAIDLLGHELANFKNTWDENAAIMFIYQFVAFFKRAKAFVLKNKDLYPTDGDYIKQLARKARQYFNTCFIFLSWNN